MKEIRKKIIHIFTSESGDELANLIFSDSEDVYGWSIEMTGENMTGEPMSGEDMIEMLHDFKQIVEDFHEEKK